ncbi:glycosyltransferase [Acholeplasma equirhinis]|uniref:alpha-monoglucosyldiacylglycerol synthase n=1 Tax=Acholeplasma equirhinis TaxID=555393 RepID=UPI00197A74E6|nr:glycosyltransferase [Acholeplasma equirhinis]MBN3490222.1 glycosyltransferase [Acholeplasma equirhinis]
MRIGIFTDAYKPLISGVVTSVVTLKEGLEKEGHEVYIIAPSAPRHYKELDPKVLRLKGFIIPRRSLKGFRWIPLSRIFTKRVRDLKLDVIHIHTEFSAGDLGLHVGKKFKIPMVYTLHTSYQDYTHYISKFLTKFAPSLAKRGAFIINNRYTKNCQMTIVPTKKIYDKMIRLKHDGRFTVIPSGIDLKPFYKSSHDPKDVEALREKLGIKQGEFVAMVVARVAKEKSLPDLVDGFIEFHKHYPNSRFIIIGDGPDRPALEHHIDKLDARDFIQTTGFVKHEEVGIYYQVADVFLNASTTETQGLTYVEALAASLPIIVRYDEVFDAFVTDGENGLFFNKTEELTELLIKVQEDKVLLEKLRKNAEASVINYSQEQYAKNVTKLYEELIKENNEKLALKNKK